MAKKPCIVCGVLVTKGSRCPDHRLHSPSWEKGNRTDPRLRAYVLHRDRWCRLCGTSGDPDNRLEADHVIPLAQGGLHHQSNMAGLCRRCHAIKSADESRNRVTIQRPVSVSLGSKSVFDNAWRMFPQDGAAQKALERR